jgi:hypothetical protein
MSPRTGRCKMPVIVPVRQKVHTLRHGAAVCEARGHCGPFVNQAFYDAFPDSIWHGMGDCLVCGSTRLIGHETEEAESSVLQH